MESSQNSDIIEEIVLNRREYDNFTAQRNNHIKEWEPEEAEKKIDITRNQGVLKNTYTSCLICERKCKNITSLKSRLLKWTERTGKKACEKSRATLTSASAITNHTKQCVGTTRDGAHSLTFTNLEITKPEIKRFATKNQHKISPLSRQRRGVRTDEEHVTYVAAAYPTPISQDMRDCVNQDDDNLPPVMACL